MPGKRFVHDDLCRHMCVIFVVGAWESSNKLREVVYDDQKFCVAGFGFAEFHVVKMYQVIEVATVYTV